jgi:hypothetical protein
MSDAELILAAARQLMTDGSVAGWRAQAVATLSRQALEAGIDAYWRDVAPGTEEASMNVQLLCLPVYAGSYVGGLAATTWKSLTGVVHVRAYDLAPTADELQGWADNVDAVLAGLAA